MNAKILQKSPSRESTERWENEGGPIARRASGPDELQIELKRHGVVSVQLTVFDWGGYRYSNAGDAIAAAKRSTMPA